MNFDRSSAKLVDLKTDPAELNNVINDTNYSAALNKLEVIQKTFPSEDTSPRYKPLKDRPWDIQQKNPRRKSGLKGLPSNAPNQKPKRNRRRSQFK